MSTASVPNWFTQAIGAPCESRYVEVDGAPIHYLIWNAHETHKPGLLFAHGFRAHARWWSFIAPFFLSRFRVAALDFAGMGDSAARKEYSARGFSRDIVGVLEHARFERATLIGHSFGGRRVARTCAEFPDAVSRAVIVDSAIPIPEIDSRIPRTVERHPKKIYPTFEAARARFRLVPEHNAAASYILDYIAEHSMKAVAGGWSWKFDENFMSPQDNETPEFSAQMLARIAVPVTYLYGDLSVVVPRALAHGIVKHLRTGHGPIAIPQSHHHVMLDQPLALVAALKAVLYSR